jgi:hypothetical protein|tara:strand:- start:990 stop:1181 length:192 start_codon:yes stop_codon:yes gene_type:complete
MILTCIAAGFFLGFFSFMFTFKHERNNLEENIKKFDKKIKKVNTLTGGLENDRINERPRRTSK